MANRPGIPPVGRNLPFIEWCQTLTAELRRFIPEVRAARIGHNRVLWRHAGLEVSAFEDRGAYTLITIRRFLSEPTHHILLAYDVKNKPIGFVTGVELTHPDKGTEMFVYELGVDESAQRTAWLSL